MGSLFFYTGHFGGKFGIVHFLLELGKGLVLADAAMAIGHVKGVYSAPAPRDKKHLFVLFAVMVMAFHCI